MSVIIGIVAVKSDSTRFKDKNFHEIDGKPMYAHNVGILLENDKINKVYVVTDDERVYQRYKDNEKVMILYEKIRQYHGERSLFDIWKWAVYSIDEQIDYVVCVLGNCIGHTNDDIDNIIQRITTDRYYEIRSFDKSGEENGIIALKNEVFSMPCISVYVGSITTKGKEIHYKEEL